MRFRQGAEETGRGCRQTRGSFHPWLSRRSRRGSGGRALAGLLATLVLSAAWMGPVPVAAASVDLVELWLREHLPEQPPGFASTTQEGVRAPGGLSTADGWALSLPDQEAVAAAGLVPEGQLDRPFWVIGAHVDRTAVYPAPPEEGEVQFFVPVLAVRNPRRTFDHAVLSYSLQGSLKEEAGTWSGARRSAGLSGMASVPQEAVEVHVWDRTGHRSWNGNASGVVLGEGVSVAAMWIGIRGSLAWADGEAWRPAGTYEGRLAANQEVPSISIKARLEPHVYLETSDELVFQVQGPGAHPSQEPLRLTYQANHPGWRLSAAVAAPEAARGGQAGVTRAPLLYRVGSSCEAEDGWKELAGASSWEGAMQPVRTTVTVCVAVETTWEDAAGTYRGSMILTLEEM